MAFWLIIGLMILVVLAAFARALLQTRESGATSAADFDIGVYKDQLNELERDLNRGTLAPEEAERARLEISRRLLAADKAREASDQGKGAPTAATYTALILSAVLLIGGGYVVYYQLGANQIGQPTYPDMPLAGRIDAAAETRATRPSQAEVEAEMPLWGGPPAETPADYIELMDKLRAAVAERPDDLQGNELLALHEGRLGNFIAAHEAKARALAAMGDTARAGDFAQYVDLLALAAGGYVSPEGEQALTEILRREPDNLVARYYSGLMLAQIGRPDTAFALWRDLLRDSPPDAAWVEPVRAQIGMLADMAGVDYTLPPLPQTMAPLAGPSAEDMAAAADMSPEDRAAMIENMVEQLMARMASEGGSPQEWAQLITALATLDRTERAIAIWQESQQTFADYPAELAMINDAATGAGLTLPAVSTPEAETPTPDSEEQARLRDLDNIATNLADQLASHGGPASDWVKLINTYGALEETVRAAQVWAQASQVFADQPEDLAPIRQAATDAGVDTDATE